MTSELLKQLGSFDSAVRDFSSVSPPSGYIEAIGWSFLVHMSSNGHSLIAAVAQFESALIEAKRLRTDVPTTILWPCNPDPVIAALIERRPVGEFARQRRIRP